MMNETYIIDKMEKTPAWYDKIFDFFDKAYFSMNRYGRSLLLFILIFLIAIIGWGEKINAFVSGTQNWSYEKRLRIAKKELALEKTKDSIRLIEKTNATIKILIAKSEIAREARNILPTLVGGESIAFWSIFSETEMTGNNDAEILKKYVKVHYSTDKNSEDEYGDYELMSDGWEWLNDEIVKRQLLYIPDIRNNPNIYKGRAASEINMGNGVGFIGAYATDVGDEYYIVGFSFNTADPIIDNPLLLKKIRGFKNFVKTAIED